MPSNSGIQPSRRVAEAHGFRVVDEAGEFDMLMRGTMRTPNAEGV